MTVIRTICLGCTTTLEMGPADVHLVTHDRGERDFYEFICPVCDELNRKPADIHVIRVLRYGKVPETCIRVPEEAFDPKRDSTLPLTSDDMLDFVLGLKEMDVLPAELGH